MPAFPLTTTDALGRSVTLPAPPRRIVSLVPSQTELLAHLGLDHRVVGLTRFCVRPKGWRAAKTIVGGTKQVNVEQVAALSPDFILANREENTPEDVEVLADMAPVYVTDVPTVDAACAMIRTIGCLTDRAEQAETLAAAIARRFATLDDFAPVRAAYLIWREPFMTIGRDTIIHDVMARGGLANVFGDRTRYPEVTLDDLAAADPDVLLLPDEPFPFPSKDTFAADLRAALPEIPIHFVDGQAFSWYGSRLRETPAYLQSLHAEMETRTAS